MRGVEAIVFEDVDVTPVEVPVKIGGVDYILRSANGDTTIKYRNAQMAATRLGPDGKVCGLDGMADVEPLLVSMCLKRKIPNEKIPGEWKLAHVSEADVRAWPPKVLEKLYDTARVISGLKDDESLEGMEKQLAELQKRIEEKRKEEEALGNS